MSLHFDINAEAYDAMIDWPKRLAAETPFYYRLFDRFQARTVLDAACGTGRHAAMFANWGLEVQAADLNPDMIAHCRTTYVQAQNLNWIQRSFCAPADRQFDVVLCTGNSLAVLDDSKQIEQAISAMLQSVRPGGALVVHVVNVFSRPEGPTRWDKSVRMRLSKGDCLITKGIHRCGDWGYVDFLLTHLEGGQSELSAHSIRFQGFRADPLAAIATRHGAQTIEFLGGYDQQPYNESTSPDLIMIASP